MHILNKAQRQEVVKAARDKINRVEQDGDENRTLDIFYRNEQSYNTEW